MAQPPAAVKFIYNEDDDQERKDAMTQEILNLLAAGYEVRAATPLGNSIHYLLSIPHIPQQIQIDPKMLKDLKGPLK